MRWSGTLWKHGITPWDNTFSPAKVFANKGKLFSNIKGERQRYGVFDCIVLLDRDTWIMPKKQIVDTECVTVYL